jgi:hypothetical protein
MTDDTPRDPPHDPAKPIALGGPVEPGETPAPSVPRDGEPERAPEPDVITQRTAATEPSPAASHVPTSERDKPHVLMPLLGLLGFVILAGAIAYLWVRPVQLPPMPAMPTMPPDESGAVAALRSDVAALKTQLAALDSRESSDVATLHAAIAALPTPASAPPAQNPTPPAPPAPVVAQAAPAQVAADAALAQRVASLSDRLDQIEAAEAAQAQKTQSMPSAADLSSVTSRVDTVAQRESRDSNAIRQDLSLVQQQLATLSDQAQALTKTSAALPELTAQADRLRQIVRAQDALRAGLPLGAIAKAPEALVRYEETAPPTEASLRLSFADAARAAVKAGEPTPDQGQFWHRVWLRVQNLVMVRQGDRVILGDPTSAILAHAQTVLDAGDLSGALTVLGGLTGPAAAAMAHWETQVRALLQAREALSQMAAG